MDFQHLNRAEKLSFCGLGISALALILSLLGSSAPSPEDESSLNTVQSTTGQPSIHQPLASQSEASSPSSNKPGGMTLADLSRASAEVARQASKSVVRIDVSIRKARREADELESYFGRFPDERLGSGVVVDSGGLVVTNYHVIRGAESVSVVDAKGVVYEAEVVGFDALTDFALMRVPDLKLPPIAWSNSDQLAAGQLVWAIGSPFGLDQSVSMGIISSTHRSSMLDSPFQDFLQTDASINPGNSGGALADAEGHLIGINTAIAGDRFQGVSFALPSNTARQVIDELKQRGQISRGWIGAQLGTVNAARAALAGLSDGQGAFVESLSAGNLSPAQAGGLQVGDIVVEFEAQKVTGPLALLRQIARHPVDTIAKLTVIRNGNQQVLEVKVMERP